MVNIKQAVDAVTEYLDSIEPLVPVRAARLEEFDYDPDLGLWTLTFSFDDVFGAQRIFRTFKVDDSRNVLSMKIRQPEESTDF